MAKAKGNKSQAIRDELQATGLDSSPTQIATQLRERGIKVSTGLVSIIKSRMKKGKGGRGRRSAIAKARSAGEKIAVTDVLALQELARRIGAGNLKKLTEAIS